LLYRVVGAQALMVPIFCFMPRGIVVINLVNNRTKPGFKWGFILIFFSQNNVVLVLKN
jgi:hypothetical protein